MYSNFHVNSVNVPGIFVLNSPPQPKRGKRNRFGHGCPPLATVWPVCFAVFGLFLGRCWPFWPTSGHLDACSFCLGVFGRKWVWPLLPVFNALACFWAILGTGPFWLRWTLLAAPGCHWPPLATLWPPLPTFCPLLTFFVHGRLLVETLWPLLATSADFGLILLMFGHLWPLWAHLATCRIQYFLTFGQPE